MTDQKIELNTKDISSYPYALHCIVCQKIIGYARIDEHRVINVMRTAEHNPILPGYHNIMRHRNPAYLLTELNKGTKGEVGP